MKNLLLALLALTFSITNLNSQYFGIEGAKWSYKAVRGSHPEKLITIESIGIQQVLGKSCNILQRTNGSCQTGGETNYVYFENGIVYWYNEFLNSFTILYDFNAVAGDSWTVKIKDCEVMITIDSVSYETIDGELLKVLHPKEPITEYENSRIIERLGIQQFLFPAYSVQECGVLCEGYHIKDGLRCYEDNQISYQKINNQEECFILTHSNELDEEYEVVLAPTISDSEFTVQIRGKSLVKISNIKIVNLNGTLLKSLNKINSNFIKFDLTQSGLYFIVLTLNNDIVITQKVIVH